MSLGLVRAITAAENNDDFHLGRLLLLLLAVDNNKFQPVEGITKLAKLDFLLRYPNCLERALVAVEKDAKLAEVQPYERTTIESKMIRFKYGPWDSRYRRWIGLLSARGLVNVEIQKRTIMLSLTDRGREVSNLFSKDLTYSDLNLRSQLVFKIFGRMSASRIKDFIYEVFPELETMKWGEEIHI
jgi:hypothetical protein